MRTHTKFPMEFSLCTNRNLNAKMEEIYMQKPFVEASIENALIQAPPPLPSAQVPAQCFFQCFIGQKKTRIINSHFSMFFPLDHNFFFPDITASDAAWLQNTYSAQKMCTKKPFSIFPYAQNVYIPYLHQCVHAQTICYICAHTRDMSTSLGTTTKNLCVWFILTRTQIFDYYYIFSYVTVRHQTSRHTARRKNLVNFRTPKRRTKIFFFFFSVFVCFFATVFLSGFTLGRRKVKMNDVQLYKQQHSHARTHAYSVARSHTHTRTPLVIIKYFKNGDCRCRMLKRVFLRLCDRRYDASTFSLFFSSIQTLCTHCKHSVSVYLYLYINTHTRPYIREQNVSDTHIQLRMHTHTYIESSRFFLRVVSFSASSNSFHNTKTFVRSQCFGHFGNSNRLNIVGRLLSLTMIIIIIHNNKAHSIRSLHRQCQREQESCLVPCFTPFVSGWVCVYTDSGMQTKITH